MLASVASTESPSAPPTCWLVLTRPETRPESSGVAVDIASVISDGNASPPPRPIASVAGSSCDRYVACVPGIRKSTIPTATSAMLGTSARPSADPLDQPSGDAQRHHGDAERQRQEGEADLDRVVAEHVLEVQRTQEEHAEQSPPPATSGSGWRRRRRASGTRAAASAGWRPSPAGPGSRPAAPLRRRRSRVCAPSPSRRWRPRRSRRRPSISEPTSSSAPVTSAPAPKPRPRSLGNSRSDSTQRSRCRSAG